MRQRRKERACWDLRSTGHRSRLRRTAACTATARCGTVSAAAPFCVVFGEEERKRLRRHAARGDAHVRCLCRAKACMSPTSLELRLLIVRNRPGWRSTSSRSTSWSTRSSARRSARCSCSCCASRASRPSTSPSTYNANSFFFWLAWCFLLRALFLHSKHVPLTCEQIVSISKKSQRFGDGLDVRGR